MPTDAVVELTSWEEPVTFWLNLSPTSQGGICIWHHYLGKEPVTRQIIGPRREPATIILLYGHGIKLALNDFLFDLEINASVNPH